MTDVALKEGMRIPRRFTRAGEDPFDTIEWQRRDSRITNPDGSIVFEMIGAEVPAPWSQVATDIIVSKYFRKAGVPQTDEDGNTVLDEEGNPVLGPERSARQTIGRLAATWRAWGEDNGYFASADDAQAFQDEITYMLLHQIGSPNSPQWFNTGLNSAYGLTGPAQGFWYVDPETEESVASDDSYTRPAPHACFIMSVKDDLVNEGGIMDLWLREARLFKYGAGTGSNFSAIRGEGESLSGGGKSSGIMSFLKIGDRAAGAIKCLHEDTEIVTDDGVVPIRAVEPGDHILTRRGLGSVSAVHDNGVQPLIRVKTALGDEITCTPEHRFWVRSTDGEGWKEARDIRPTDFVQIDVSATPVGTTRTLMPVAPGHHNETQHQLPVTLDEQFALWLGWVTGDGSVTTSPGAKFVAVQIGDTDSDLRIRYTELARRIFGSAIHVFESRHRDKPDASSSVRFSSSQVIRFLEANGLRKKNSEETDIPDLVKSSPPAVRAAFLSGLFEADGHIDNGYPVLSTVSQHLARDAHRLLLGLGIPSSIKEQRNRQAAHGDRPIFLLRVIGGEGVRRFSKLVGFVSERKARLLEAAVERKSASRYETQWALPHVARELNKLWLEGSPELRRALAPYCRYAEPRALSLLRATALFHRFPDELVGTIVESFASGHRFYTQVSVGEAEDGRVYDLTVEGFHEYTVQGLVTHNSGGTTRRAAKMVILDLDHPDIEQFIGWKMEEENKVRALIAAGYPSDFNGEAYQTVSGQNSNNSVRVPHDFIQAVVNDEMWALTARKDGHVMKKVRARHLWRQIAEAAWACADPGVQFDTTINEWHTSPAEGRIRASNPCSEYLFLDNTACNLASLNLVKFYDDEEQAFDIDAYLHAIRLWTIVLEVSVTMAQFPSREIAEGSYNYRTLGLGYANLGSLLMRTGIPYDSDEGRAIAGSLTGILTGHSYATSAEMASVLGPFPKYELNRESMLRVIRNHRRAAYDSAPEDYEGLSHYVMGIDPDLAPADLIQTAQLVWDNALNLGEQHGYRNAQATVLAPTGTIGLQMDCDTTGVEPDFALVKFKKLAGGGYFKIANQSIAPALRHLGYTNDQIDEIVDYVVGTMTLLGAPGVNRASLTSKGFTTDDLRKVEEILTGVFELRHAFNVFVLGEETMRRLGFTEDQFTSFDFDMLAQLGFSADDIRAANDIICGRQSIEGAPYLRDEHLPVFDTANRNGKYGERFIHHNGHIMMMAAAQPFISGAISKTINMPNEVTVEDIEDSYKLSAQLGLKSMALYRDGSKASQPLSATSDEGEHPDDELEGLPEALEDEARIVTGAVPAVHFAPGVSPTMAYQGVNRPRFLLPARRTGFTQEARVGGHKLFVRTGDYEDGTLGEVFIDLAKEGATLRGVLSCFAIAVSKGLQYGVPLEEFVDTFTFQTFEPRGIVEGHPNIKMANSIVDYVFRTLGLEYLGRTDLVQVPPTETRSLPEPPKGMATQAGHQLGLEEARMEDDIDAQTRAAAFVDADVLEDTGSPPNGPATPAAEPRSSHDLTNGAGVTNGRNEAQTTTVMTAADAQAGSVQAALASNMGDAPLCDTCGHITVRNGSCYRCMNCGDSKGCS